MKHRVSRILFAAVLVGLAAVAPSHSLGQAMVNIGNRVGESGILTTGELADSLLRYGMELDRLLKDRARLDFDQAFEQRARNVLSESQQARLPAKRPEPEGDSSIVGGPIDDGISISVTVTATENDHGPVEQGDKEKTDDR